LRRHHFVTHSVNLGDRAMRWRESPI
jgi:hypothetical protein